MVFIYKTDIQEAGTAVEFYGLTADPQLHAAITVWDMANPTRRNTTYYNINQIRLILQALQEGVACWEAMNTNARKSL